MSVADLQGLQAVAVGDQAQAGAGMAIAVVDIHDERDGMEDGLHALSHGAARLGVWPVDFGQ